jgi:hypothetical protein
LDSQDQQVHKVLKDRPVRPAHSVRKDLLDQLDHRVESALLVLVVLKDLPALRDRKVHRVLKDLLVLRVQLDLPVRKVALLLQLLQFYVT